MSGVTTANTTIDGTNNSILLASLIFDVSANATGPISLSATPLVDPFGDRFTVVGAVFPDSIVVDDGSISLNVTAVPEPSSIALLSFVAIPVLLRRRKANRG